MGKVMWVVNKIMDTHFFNTKYVDMVDGYMKKNKKVSIKEMLLSDNYQFIQETG